MRIDGSEPDSVRIDGSEPDSESERIDRQQACE